MLFFKSYSVAKIVGVGQAKASEEQGYIPLIQIIPNKGKKNYPNFFSSNGLIGGQFKYIRAMRLLSLTLHTQKLKFGIPFEQTEHLATIAAIMKMGMLAINDKVSGQTVIYPIHAFTEDFYHEWKEIVLPDFLKDDIQVNKRVAPHDIVAYRDEALRYLENNWMVEKEDPMDDFV